jgi:hypothetical protein
MVATTVNVSNAAELQTALKNATGGETILLAAGDYGTLQLIDGKTKYDVTHSAAAPVTIRSADANQPAVFTGLDLRSTSGFSLENLTFDYTYKPTDENWTAPFSVSKSSDITIRGCTFDGDVAVNRNAIDDGYGFGIGFSAIGCTNLVFEDNTTYTFHRAARFDNCDNTVVRGNDVHSMRMDGIVFAQMQGVLIEENHLHDFKRSPSSADHADMIQFWTNNTTRPSTDIVIRGNTLDIGTGDYTQSIFMRNDLVDQGLAGPELYYRNVLIEENTIYNDHEHGITVGETAGLIIRNNSVLHANGATEGVSGSVSVPKINVAGPSTDVTIQNNLAGVVAGNDPATRPADWTVENNLIVQDSDEALPNHYGTTFITSTLEVQDGAHGFVALADGVIEQFGQGSAATRYAMALNGGEAFFNVVYDPIDGPRRIFDATFMADILGAADLTADYRWDFGCGHTASGKMVAHDYAAYNGGLYDVILTIELANGVTLTGNAVVPVHGELLVDFDGSTGTFRSHDFGFIHPIATPAAMDGEAIQLGAPGVSASLPSEELLELRGSDHFDINFKIKADTVGASGELFRDHQEYIASINSTGDLVFQVFTADGNSTKLVTRGLDLNDGLEHEIILHIQHGTIRITADGVANLKHTLSEPLNFNPYSTFVIGNPWGAKNFAGDMSFFEIRLDTGEYPADHDHAEVIVLVPDNVAGTGMHDPGWTGRVIDLAADTTILLDNAHVVTGPDGPVLYLDGSKDYASIGRQVEFETSDRLGFSVDFQRDTVDGVEDRLIWNHMRIGLTLTDDGLTVQIATLDQGFMKFTADNLGLDDAELHRAEVMVDTVADRLQVLLDGQIVLDATNADFDLLVAGAKQSGWTIGNPWNRYFDGEVHDFRLGDEFHFVDTVAGFDDAFLI